MIVAAGMLAATSCSDFKDYNKTPVDALPEGNLTLWENISQNEQLQGFASLIKQAGFDTELDNTRFYTVWAPKDGTYDLTAYQQLSKEDLLNQFVKNHVAEYGYQATGALNTRIHTLNEKSYTFEGSNGAYTFDGVNISKANQPGVNGLMHIMDGVAPFRYNLYEYLKRGENIDSLRNHFMKYETTQLDQNASVKGPMVDGVQTYIDSVMITSNSYTRQLNARLDNEDSTYTFVMPTNKAFLEMYNRVKPYFNFIQTTKMLDVENLTGADATNSKTVTVNANYMTDSLVRRIITRNLVYSNNDGYNKWLIGEGQSLDTIRSTVRNKFSNPDAILKDYMIGEPVEMSNGYARIVDSIAFYPWETYCPELEIPLRNYMVRLFPENVAQAHRNQSIPEDSLEVVFGKEAAAELTNYRYLWIEPGGSRTKPDFFVQLPNVQSTTYNFYVVFLPTSGRFKWMVPPDGEDRPNLLNFQLNYCDAKGNTAVYNFSKAYADSLQTGGTLPAVPTAVNMNTAFMNNPEKTDTVFIGQFKFPVAYNGLGNEYFPTIRVTNPMRASSSAQTAMYTRDVRIAAIIMRPVELDEYEAKKQ